MSKRNDAVKNNAWGIFKNRTVWISVASAVLLFLAFFTTYMTQSEKQLRGELNRRAESAATVASAALTEYGGLSGEETKAALDKRLKLLKASYGVLEASVYVRENAAFVLYSGIGAAEPQSLEPADLSKIKEGFSRDGDVLEYTARLSLKTEPGAAEWVMAVVLDATETADAYFASRLLVSFVSLGLTAAMLAALLLLLRKISWPLYERLAYGDGMTNTGNRAAFDKRMNVTKPSRLSGKGIIVCDLNYLKQVNDVYGHTMGDSFIKRTAAFLNKTFKDMGSLYRIGGDEFAVIMDDFDREEVEERLKRLRAGSPYVFKLKGKREAINSVAYGCAAFDKAIDFSLYDTFNRADDEMYKLKKEMKTGNLLSGEKNWEFLYVEPGQT
jgi:diguanylate cyclase (GGDEF)-like protein